MGDFILALSACCSGAVQARLQPSTGVSTEVLTINNESTTLTVRLVHAANLAALLEGGLFVVEVAAN